MRLATPASHRYPRQYYYALVMQPVQLVGEQLFVWGSRPLPNSLAVACAYVVSTTTGAVTAGPCLRSFGEGESAEAIDLRCATDAHVWRMIGGDGWMGGWMGDWMVDG
jgi:hypothetical protein